MGAKFHPQYTSVTPYGRPPTFRPRVSSSSLYYVYDIHLSLSLSLCISTSPHFFSWPSIFFAKFCLLGLAFRPQQQQYHRRPPSPFQHAPLQPHSSSPHIASRFYKPSMMEDPWLSLMLRPRTPCPTPQNASPFISQSHAQALATPPSLAPSFSSEHGHLQYIFASAQEQLHAPSQAAPVAAFDSTQMLAQSAQDNSVMNEDEIVLDDD